MSVERICARYARSLFEVAKEQKVLAAVQADMDAVGKLCDASLELRHFLKTPIIRPEKKAKILQQLFAKSLHTTSIQLIHLLARKGRAAYLQGLATAFIARYQSYKGQVPAQLLTAQPVTLQEEHRFTNYISRLTQKEALLSTKILPKLLGGFIIRVGDLQIDKSVAAQLRNLRKTLTQPPSLT